MIDSELEGAAPPEPLARADWLEARLAGIGRPLTDWLANLPDDLGRDALPASIDSLGTALIRTMDLGAATVRDVQARWREELTRVFVTQDLAWGRPFGTSGYERVRAALARLPRAEDRRDGILARLAPARPGPALMLAALAGAAAADLAVSLALTGDLPPSHWSPFVAGLLSGSQNVPLSLLALPALLSAAVTMAFAPWRRRGGTPQRRRPRRLKATVHDWVNRSVAEQFDVSVHTLRGWLEHELANRIGDRREQAARYPEVALRSAAGDEASAALVECRAGTGVRLSQEDWSEMARRLAPAQPGGLLEEFAPRAAGQPQRAAGLAGATAEEMHREVRSWLEGSIRNELTGKLAQVLADLPGRAWRRSVRSLRDRAVPGLAPRPGSEGDFQHLAAVPPPGDVGFQLRTPLLGAVELDEVVESALPGRVDLVTISRRSFDAAELIHRNGGSDRLSLARFEDVLAELPTPEIRQLVLEHGLMDALKSERHGALRVHPADGQDGSSVPVGLEG